jgi:1-phosphofructokinase family hexose kinase
MNTSQKPVICIGLTPCIQRIIEFDNLEKESVNRASKVTVGIGGKGANTARMVSQLGGVPVLVEFVGGNNGTLLEQMLDEEAIGYRHVQVEGETRICQTLIEQGNPETTELVEEMPPITADNWAHMLKLIGSLELADAIVAVSGKLPAGAPADAYARICKVAEERGARVILDTQGDPLLKALEHKPHMVKINADELMASVGQNDVRQAADQLLSLGAETALITNGSKTSFYFSTDGAFEINPVQIEAVNPVGSGDAVTAGVAVALNNEAPAEDMLKLGMACGAANVLNLLSGYLKPDDVERLREQVVLQPVGK